MQAYHNDPQLKADFIKLLTWHKDQDRIVQGSYWTDEDDEDEGIGAVTLNGFRFENDGRGCAVGCSIESLRIITKRTDLAHNDHAAYEALIGVPRVLARLEDSFFERLPIDEAKEWPITFAEAIPVGADLSLVWARFAVWLLGDSQDGVICFAKNDRHRKVIQDAVDAYLRLLEGNAPSFAEWHAIAVAAYDVAAYDVAAAADGDAAYAVAAAFPYRTQVRQKQARQAAKLLELLRAA